MENTEGKGSGWLLGVLCQVHDLVKRPHRPDERDLCVDAAFRNLLVLQLEKVLKQEHRGLAAEGSCRFSELAQVLNIKNQKAGEGEGGMARRSKDSFGKLSPAPGWQMDVMWALLTQ